MTVPTRFPLQWPVGWKRTAVRDTGRFGRSEQRSYGSGEYSYRRKEDITVAGAVQRLLGELQRMGVTEDDIVISTNIQLRLDSLPRSGQGEPADPGAAVYWRDRIAVGGPQDRCMAIDRYSKVAQNIAALAATIEAMRAIERHGGAAILDRAFTGFTALAAPIATGMKRPWREVLEFGNGPANEHEITRNYRILAKEFHPDRQGGDSGKMTELNAARVEALKEIAA